MTEFFQEAISPHQLPATIVLGFVILYWLVVAVGGIDFDSSILDGVDLPEPGESAPGASALGGAWVSAGRWLGFAKVPIAVWGSFAVLFTWATALILNYELNGEPGDRSVARATLLFFPSAAVGLLVTRIVTIPVGRLFAAMADADTEAIDVVGRLGQVTTSTVDETFGQLQVDGGGAPVVLNVRVRPGAPPLQKGDRARVAARSEDGGHYLVEPAPAEGESLS
jgi:hypothetical protein